MQAGTSPVIEAFTYAVGSMIASVVAISQSRFDPDIVAVIGAVLAAGVVMVEAWKKERSMLHMISVLIASFVIGSCAPGAYMWAKHPDMVAAISWHWWMLGGFGCGLMGWKLTAWGMKLSVGELPTFVTKLMSLFSKKP